MFTSYRIAFRSVSQCYTVWCEHTFLTIFMFSVSVKTLSIMCFDARPFEQNTRESTAILTTKKSRENQKFISFGEVMQ